jgi:hypothetical protein
VPEPPAEPPEPLPTARPPSPAGSEHRAELSALPSPAARAAAFVAILLGGAAGGVIGYTLVRLQCDGDCALQRGLGAFFGSIVAASGMSVVAVLVLRAAGEWRQLGTPGRP